MPLRPDHGGAFADLGDPEAYAWHTSTPPLTEPAARASIAALLADPTLMAFAVTGTDGGELRAHRRRHDGTVADTAYFSVVRAEWPVVRRGLLERSAPAEPRPLT